MINQVEVINLRPYGTEDVEAMSFLGNLAQRRNAGDRKICARCPFAGEYPDEFFSGRSIS